MDFNNNSYNLDELDLALSEPRHQAAAVGGPSGANTNIPSSAAKEGRRTAPGTRRGSLVPNVSAAAAPVLFTSTGDDDEDEEEDADGEVESGSGRGVKNSSSSSGRKKNKEKKKQQQYQDLNLFTFGVKELSRSVLLPTVSGDSRVSYHEYAVFSPPPKTQKSKKWDKDKDKDSGNVGEDEDEDWDQVRSPSIMSEGKEALRMARDALRNGYGLDDEGEFTPKPKGKQRLQGRVRQIIARRRASDRTADSLGTVTDGLDLTIEDYQTLKLHPATLPTLCRVTSESSFWDVRKETFHLILSFSSNPQPPYDFLSMRYSLRKRTTTALIRRSFDTRWHDEDALDEYERRFDACRARWAHPLVLPIVLLQVQLLRTEEAVIANNGDVLLLEGRVDAVTGTTGQANAEAYRRNLANRKLKEKLRNGRGQAGGNGGGGGDGGGGIGHPFKPLNKRLSNLRDFVEEKVGSGSNHFQRRRTSSGLGIINGGADAKSAASATARATTESCNNSAGSPASLYDPEYVPPQTIYLMKEAHDVLKGSIQLLDTLRWMERAVKLLIQVGDELDARVNELKSRDDNSKKRGAKSRNDDDGQNKDEEENEDEDEDEDDLSSHWQEIRQYLDCIWRLCTSLETDRRMSELRCRAQIDIIYSKMAQEDNNLNARMAVASTRDSSSMKALAVITAIFLPGEYIGTLFGVSMFNWEKGTAGDPAASQDAANWLPSPTIMPSFWIYWAFTIPLTLLILSAWRGWWVNQDRYFRRHLSHELSNERYWTTDGKPRALETTFTQDFFSLFSLSGARSTTNSTVLGNHRDNNNNNNNKNIINGGGGSGYGVYGMMDEGGGIMNAGPAPLKQSYTLTSQAGSSSNGSNNIVPTPAAAGAGGGAAAGLLGTKNSPRFRPQISFVSTTTNNLPGRQKLVVSAV